MNTALSQPPPADLPYDDGVPLDSNWHRLAMTLLIQSLSYLWRERTDFFVGGNMFLYFNPERARNQDFRGPDFFFVWGVDGQRLRRYWATWEEQNKTPNVIIELMSPSTAEEDRTTKKDVYEQMLQTPEYFIYDPETQRLEGWRLSGQQRYEPILADERGWLWSAQLGLWLGTWQGKFDNSIPDVYPRFYDKEGNLVLNQGEAEAQRADAEKQQKEMERQRADAEKQRADAEQQRADAEQQRADAERQQKETERQRADAQQQRADAERQQKEMERQRADALAAEVVRLRARLGEPPAKQPPP